jgi:hypothetical protein
MEVLDLYLVLCGTPSPIGSLHFTGHCKKSQIQKADAAQ